MDRMDSGEIVRVWDVRVGESRPLFEGDSRHVLVGQGPLLEGDIMLYISIADVYGRRVISQASGVEVVPELDLTQANVASNPGVPHHVRWSTLPHKNSLPRVCVREWVPLRRM